MSLATSQVMRLESSRTIGAPEIMGKGGAFGNLSLMPYSSLIPHQKDHGHCPGLSLGPSWQQKSRQEELEGVSALGSAEDPKLAVK